MKPDKIKHPEKKEINILRLMILLGLASILNFFYWFLDFKLVDSRILYWLLLLVFGFNILKLIYIWYHYWSITVPRKVIREIRPTVDVFTTFFPGEPYEMVTETLKAIIKIQYPHTTYLCDEANDSYLKAFCLENGIIHVTRNNRIDAKAGNINNALKIARGEICLVLDPDHVPHESILDELIPFFEDEKVGFVQSVQSYYNTNETLVAKGAAEQTYHFYGPIMMSMNAYGTVNAIGANCCFRRKALDSIGGHAAGLSEDMHTAMQLHAKGWKSVYVPKILTKGLVPATLTSYYKQQLKWSRGTLELLFAVYPRLFKKFAWRQKIHYGLLPFHYFSGIFYLLGFLIPIISLCTATTPWKGNLINFGLFYLPLFASVVGIRFYVQRWVLGNKERGFHLTGGLLQSATWWIFLTGFVYTQLRKKVPYLPTPKEDKESTSFLLLVPNLVIGIISVVAVFYGLSIDFTPFSIFMSGFALLNAFFMFFTVVFAFPRKREIKFSFSDEAKTHSFIFKLKNICFEYWRKSAFAAMAIIFVFTLLFQQYRENLKWEKVAPDTNEKNIVTYFGLFEPAGDNGFTHLNSAYKTSEQINAKLDIVSLYLPWNKNQVQDFPAKYLDSVYAFQSIPLITWEPWLNSFDEIDPKSHVFDLISEGHFDSFIISFSELLKGLNRPVFLRFAHEFDNPFYPWCVNDSTGASQYKTAWIHVYELFKNNNANNVIWIWNPWNPENIKTYYPGSEYVDWLGVNILNYNKINPEIKSSSFDSLYLPFHEKFIDLPQTPVMLTEYGTLHDDNYQAAWIKDAFNSIEEKYDEIESVVYFNSKYDNNIPDNLIAEGYLDWTIPNNGSFDYKFTLNQVPNYVLKPLPEVDIKTNGKKKYENMDISKEKIRGINLKKGHDWRRDYHVFSRKNLLVDYEKIKKLGVNSIRFEGNSVYDNNVVNIADEFNLQVSYGFWIPSYINFVTDSTLTVRLKKDILKKIKKLKHHTNIISWNIQNDVLYNQKDYFQKPELLYQNLAYIRWLKEVSAEIEIIDPDRPFVVDIEVHLQSSRFSKMLSDFIPNLDAIGLVVKNDEFLPQLVEFLQKSGINYLYSEIQTETISETEIYKTDQPFYITAWQDQHEKNKLTFEGITDRFGRYKTDYFKLKSILTGSDFSADSFSMRILRPAKLLREGRNLNYLGMLYNENSGWDYSSVRPDLTFEWSLLKCDKYGNYLAIKNLENGNYLNFDIPANYDTYRLMLTALKGDTVIATTISTLNTPLIVDE